MSLSPAVTSGAGGCVIRAGRPGQGKCAPTLRAVDRAPLRFARQLTLALDGGKHSFVILQSPLPLVTLE
jgi:hypothetical protein